MDPVAHQTEVAECTAAINAVLNDKHPGFVIEPKNMCLKVGDDMRNQTTGEVAPEHIGKYVLKSWNNNLPNVVDERQINVEPGSNKVYSGCWVNANVRFFGWGPNEGGRGVSAELLAVQFVRDDEAFGNVVSRDQAMQGFDTAPDAPAAGGFALPGQPQPGQGQQPAGAAPTGFAMPGQQPGAANPNDFM